MVITEHIVSFCDKTIQETAIKINDIEAILKQKLEKKIYKEIKKTITSNKVVTKKTLHHRKFMKYNSLKYKPTTTVKVKKIAEGTGNTKNRKSYKETK